MALTPGTRLGPYEVVGRLGAGGMGEVYLARDSRLDREVALKVLPSRMSRDVTSIERFRREALTLASLNHPNLATVYGFEEADDGTQLLVLERVTGVTLTERLSHGALPVEEALQIGAQLALALEVAHERGVIHRDVKPGNVMVGPRGLVKVLDFGLARRIAGLADAETPSWSALPTPDAGIEDLGPVVVPPTGAEPGVAGPVLAPPHDLWFRDSTIAPPAGAVSEDAETVLAPRPGAASEEGETALAAPGTGLPSSGSTVSMTGMTVGTPGYMSPEQVLAREVDARTDLFAFGAVLYECLSGRRPFPGSTPLEAMMATLKAAPDLSALPERTPARVRVVIERCLAKHPEERPESAREVRLEIEEVLGIRRASALREGGAVAIPQNLPAPATSFVGRQATLAACGQALEGTRLLTLLGMGGSGKTRLALRLAELRLEAFPDGAWFVDVAPMAGSDRLVEALAAALGLRDEPGRALLDGVVGALAKKRALVILDNAETQIQACALLAGRLIESCREVRLLVTSREPLAVPAEATFTVPTLEVPGPDVDTAAAAGAYESVLLFCERARAARPAFELLDDNAAAVAEICRRLDGIPLALELAAARLRLLGVEQIRARLDDRFRLLTRAGTGAPSRQQTVLAVIQWSWDQLLPPEQALLRRLAVFTGGWSLERATLVCSDSGDEFEILDLLTRLVERSLVVVHHDAEGNPRYRFLESVWRFALERLEASPEMAALRERHLAAYFDLAARAETSLAGPELAHVLRELEPEEENLLAALSWCAQVADGVQRGLQLACAVHRFWSVRGRFALGLRVLKEQLARDTARTPTPARAKALTRAAGFALTVGDYAAAGPLLEESLAICRAGGDRKGEARALAGLAVVASYEERYAEGLAISRESLAIYEELGERRGVAMLLHNIGTMESVSGHPDGGRAEFEAAIALLREVGDAASESLSLSALASSLLRTGETDAAASRLRESLARLEGLGAVREGVYALESVVEWLLAVDRAATAASLLAAASHARETLRLPRSAAEIRESERQRVRAAGALRGEELEGLFAQGASLSLEQALAAASAALGSG